VTVDRLSFACPTGGWTFGSGLFRRLSVADWVRNVGSEICGAVGRGVCRLRGTRTDERCIGPDSSTLTERFGARLARKRDGDFLRPLTREDPVGVKSHFLREVAVV